jgi:hypothetical protein
MSDSLTVELSPRQCELLLRGLRYVRSSRMLEIRDFPDTLEEDRRTELAEIRELAAMLDARTTAGSAS